MAATNGSTPKIDLYTNRICPWAHRAHIALSVLDIPFEEHTIDLDVPRTQEYLAINPRGLVPTIIYNGETITESAIVAQFLADLYPGKLVKSSVEAGGALERARINFFADTWVTKINPHLFASVRASSPEEKEQHAAALVAAAVKEIEPLLKDANPFFRGSKAITLAEVQTGSFVLRVLDFPKHGLFAPNFLHDLEAQAPNTYKWAEAVAADKHVNHIWDAKRSADRTKAKFAKSNK